MELEEARNSLDRIDNAVFLLLAERMNIIEKVAEYKIEKGIEQYQPEREKEMIEEKKKMAEENGLEEEFGEELMKLLLKYSHRLQDKKREDNFIN